METIEKLQRQILEQSRRIFQKAPISHATERAYLDTPRHLFVKRYREWGMAGWHEVTPENLEQHLAALYADRPLMLFGDDDRNVLSTISQPSFVLRMLDMLRLQPGQTVFELGTGSGWNAAMIGRLVGPDGRVVSLELIPELARTAAEILQTVGIKNVSVIAADGGDGHAAGAPYDRMIFTAGAYDLPHAFHDQIKDGGLLMLVIKLKGGGDTLYVLQKTGDHFESVESIPCGFVQLKGKYEMQGFESTSPDALPDWPRLKDQEVSRTRFWWGGKGQESFAWRTMGIRFFLDISDPLFRPFKTEKSADRLMEEHYFGLWDPERRSLVMANDDWLIAYGNDLARERLLEKVRQWMDLGMPAAASFKLHVHPSDCPAAAHGNQWMVKRGESQFVWSLEE